MHLDVIESFTLAEIVVISSGQQARSVAPNDCFQVSSVNVEGHSFESVHLARLNWIGEEALTMEITRSN
ncbi:hypothetical protein Hanom_Chr17g01552401 [Helianthus anomalus]